MAFESNGFDSFGWPDELFDRKRRLRSINDLANLQNLPDLQIIRTYVLLTSCKQLYVLHVSTI